MAGGLLRPKKLAISRVGTKSLLAGPFPLPLLSVAGTL